MRLSGPLTDYASVFDFLITIVASLTFSFSPCFAPGLPIFCTFSLIY